jgi:hypothetical protein
MVSVYVEHFGQAILVKKDGKELEFVPGEAAVLAQKLAAVCGYRIVEEKKQLPEQPQAAPVEEGKVEGDEVVEEGEVVSPPVPSGPQRHPEAGLAKKLAQRKG